MNFNFFLIKKTKKVSISFKEVDDIYEGDKRTTLEREVDEAYKGLLCRVTPSQNTLSFTSQ